MIYLLSRSVTQGRGAGVISLLGVMLAFIVYITATMLGLSALFTAVPAMFVIVKTAGAAYLLWLAWNAFRTGNKQGFALRALTIDPPKKLFLMGFMTNLLNPKSALLYVSLLPQFQNPGAGPLLVQSAKLGAVQMTVSFAVNLLVILSAGTIASWFGQRPSWLKIQRWFMGTALTALAVRMAFERR